MTHQPPADRKFATTAPSLCALSCGSIPIITYAIGTLQTVLIQLKGRGGHA
jgi:hypothetical protein